MLSGKCRNGEVKVAMNAENTELARALGELQGQVAGLQREMTAHRQESRDSTDRLHRRISDSQTALLSKFDENAAAIRAVEAAHVGDVAVSKFKRTMGYALLALSGGIGAEILRGLKVWFSPGG